NQNGNALIYTQQAEKPIRFTSGDIRDIRHHAETGNYDIVVANPAFITKGLSHNLYDIRLEEGSRPVRIHFWKKDDPNRPDTKDEEAISETYNREIEKDWRSR